MRYVIRVMFVLPGFFIAAFLPAVQAAAQRFDTAQRPLPPEIMADRFLLKADQLEGKKDFAGALKVLEKILALQKNHNFKLPDEFHFKYARVAMSADSIRIAYDSVIKYLSTAGREGEFYKEALALSLAAEDELEEVEILPEETCTGKPDGSSCWMALANQPDCYVWNSSLRTGQSVRWTGRCSGNVARGEATLTWAVTDADSSRVTGSSTGRLRKGKFDGHLVNRASDGAIREGSYVNGKVHGKWVRRRRGIVSEWQYVNGKRHGHYITRWPDGGKQKGEFVDNIRDGIWLFYYEHNPGGLGAEWKCRATTYQKGKAIEKREVNPARCQGW